MTTHQLKSAFENMLMDGIHQNNSNEKDEGRRALSEILERVRAIKLPRPPRVQRVLTAMDVIQATDLLEYMDGTRDVGKYLAGQPARVFLGLANGLRVIRPDHSEGVI